MNINQKLRVINYFNYNNKRPINITKNISRSNYYMAGGGIGIPPAGGGRRKGSKQA